MADKFLTIVNGQRKLREAKVTSAGAGDAGKIPALDAGGKLDSSLMPNGIGAEVTVAPASENLAAGDEVNLWDDSGTLKARKADADNNRPAHGFVDSAVTSPANATVYHSGVNSDKSGLTPGSEYFLSATAGGVVTGGSVPSGSGGIIQKIGLALSATELLTYDYGGEYDVIE